jgi:hypothetical protein
MWVVRGVLELPGHQHEPRHGEGCIMYLFICNYSAACYGSGSD